MLPFSSVRALRSNPAFRDYREVAATDNPATAPPPTTERLAFLRPCVIRAYAQFSLVCVLCVLWLLAMMQSCAQVRDLTIAVAVSPLALLCLRSLRNFDFAGSVARARKRTKKRFCALPSSDSEDFEPGDPPKLPKSRFSTLIFDIAHIEIPPFSSFWALGRILSSAIIDMAFTTFSWLCAFCYFGGKLISAIYGMVYNTISSLSARVSASFTLACRTTKTIINMLRLTIFAVFAFRGWVYNAFNTWAEAELSWCFSTAATMSTLFGGVLDDFDAHKMLHKMLPKDNGWRAWYDNLGIIPGGICFALLCIATILRLAFLFAVFLLPVVGPFLCVRLPEFVVSLTASVCSHLVTACARLFARLVVGFNVALEPSWWPYPVMKYYILKIELRKAPPRGRSWFRPCCGHLRASSVEVSKPIGAGSKARDARLDSLGKRSELEGSGTAHDAPPSPPPSVHKDPVSECEGHHDPSPIAESAPPFPYGSEDEITGIFARLLKRGIAFKHCTTMAQPRISTLRVASRPFPRLPARHVTYIMKNGKFVPAFNPAGVRVIKVEGLKREKMARRRQPAPTPAQQPAIVPTPSPVAQHTTDEVIRSESVNEPTVSQDSSAKDDSATLLDTSLLSSVSSASPVLESGAPSKLEEQASASMEPLAPAADFESLATVPAPCKEKEKAVKKVHLEESSLRGTPEPESTTFAVALDIKPSNRDAEHAKPSSNPAVPQDTGIIDNPASLPASAALSPPTSESAAPQSSPRFGLGAPAPPPTSKSFGSPQARSDVDHSAAPFQQSFVVDTPMSEVPASVFPSGSFPVPSFSASSVDPAPREDAHMINVAPITSSSAPFSSFSNSDFSNLPQEMDLDIPAPPASTPPPPANNEMEVDPPAIGTGHDEQQLEAVLRDDNEMLDAGTEVGLYTLVHTPVNKEVEMEQCFDQPSAPNQTPFGAAFGTSFGNGNLQAEVVGSITSWQPSTYGAQTVGQQQSYGFATSASPSGFAFSSGNQHTSTPFPASGLPAGPVFAAGTQGTSTMFVLGNGNPQSEADRSVPTLYPSQDGPQTVVNQEFNDSTLFAPPSGSAFDPGTLDTSTTLSSSGLPADPVFAAGTQGTPTPSFTSGQPQQTMSPQEQDWLTKLLEQVSSDAMTGVNQSATPPMQSSSAPSVQQDATPASATPSTYHAPDTSAPSQNPDPTLPSGPTHRAPATSLPPPNQDSTNPAPSAESQSSSTDVPPPQNPSLAQSATPVQESELSKGCIFSITNDPPEVPQRVLRKKIAPLKRRGGNAPVACPMPKYQPPPVEKALPTAPPSGKSLAGLFLTVDDTKTDIFMKEIDKYVKYRRICADADRRREKKEKIVAEFVETLTTEASDGTFAVSFSTLIRSYRRCLQSFAIGNSHHYLCVPAAAALKALGKDGTNLREEWSEKEYMVLLMQIARMGHPSDVSADVLVLGRTDRPSLDPSDRPSLAWPMVFWALKLWIVSANFEDVDFQRDQMEDACDVAGDMLRMLIEMPKSALNLQEEEEHESDEDDEEESFNN